MEVSQILTVVSSVLGAFITALFTARNADKKIEIENITQERAKWRERMREITHDLIINHATNANSEPESKQQALIAELTTRLSLFDQEDEKILEIANSCFLSKESKYTINDFQNAMSLLLKHDWERAKYESKPFYFRFMSRQADRCGFEYYKDGVSEYSKFKTQDIVPNFTKSALIKLTTLIVLLTTLLIVLLLLILCCFCLNELTQLILCEHP